MKIYYKPQVAKQIKKIPQRDLKKIFKKLRNLSEDPLSGKPLKGELEGLYSIKAWPYRIVYEIKNEKIIIYSIAHRQGVYK